MVKFNEEFNELHQNILDSTKILLVAHTRPDGDTVGSVVALESYLESIKKDVDIACFDPFPGYLKPILPTTFISPEQLNPKDYDLIIACDSVERGFDKIQPKLDKNQKVALIDHHPDITIKGNINIIEPEKSSTCEIIYKYFVFTHTKINPYLATALLTGILSDTGNLQHANTSTEVMGIASNLIKRGAPVSKIVETVFSNKKISTLQLWGIALKKARVNPKNKMIVTVLTKKDIEECQADPDDISQIASILNTVPGTNFALVLSQRDRNTIKGSLRSEEYKGVDVSAIAHRFGGGGHKLASGFEIKGNIVETADGWKII